MAVGPSFQPWCCGLAACWLALVSFGCGPRPAPRPQAKPASESTAIASSPNTLRPDPPPRKDLSELLEPAPAEPAARQAAAGPALDRPDLLANVDEQKVAAEGIRRLAGKRLVLYTDLPARREIDELPELFDQAYPAWCKFFGVEPAQPDRWQAVGCLIADKARFERAGLLPNALPKFANGYSVGRCLWLFDQTSPYYRRHLLLHEGAHAFMDTVLESGGPPWYVEGLAELLGTHRWQEGKLALGVVPKNSDETPRLGRIEMIQKAFAAGKALDLGQVLAFGPQAHLEVEPYAWCWAAATLLDRSPDTHDRFRAMARSASPKDVPKTLAAVDPGGALQLAERWQVFMADLDYGYDFNRNQADLRPSNAPPLAAPATAILQADRGWQNTGLHLQGGRHYRIAARGRFQVATEADPLAAGGPPAIWWSEAGGVTLRYHRGRPLGELLAAIRPNDFDPAQELTPLAHPQPVGLGGEFTPPRSGTLFLKINDAPGELADNAGSLEVEVSPAP